MRKIELFLPVLLFKKTIAFLPFVYQNEKMVRKKKSSGTKSTEISENMLLDAFAQMSDEVITFKKVCEKRGWSYSNLLVRIHASERLEKLYARAREDFVHAEVEQMREIAETEPDVQRARLKCDNVKWYACKVVPKFYGEKVTHSGDPDAPILLKPATPTDFKEIDD